MVYNILITKRLIMKVLLVVISLENSLSVRKSILVEVENPLKLLCLFKNVKKTTDEIKLKTLELIGFYIRKPETHSPGHIEAYGNVMRLNISKNIDIKEMKKRELQTILENNQEKKLIKNSFKRKMNKRKVFYEKSKTIKYSSLNFNLTWENGFQLNLNFNNLESERITDWKLFESGILVFPSNKKSKPLKCFRNFNEAQEILKLEQGVFNQLWKIVFDENGMDHEPTEESKEQKLTDLDDEEKIQADTRTDFNETGESNLQVEIHENKLKKYDFYKMFKVNMFSTENDDIRKTTNNEGVGNNRNESLENVNSNGKNNDRMISDETNSPILDLMIILFVFFGITAVIYSILLK